MRLDRVLLSRRNAAFSLLGVGDGVGAFEKVDDFEFELAKEEEELGRSVDGDAFLGLVYEFV